MKAAWVFLFFFCASLCANVPELECEKKWGEIDFHGKRVMRYRLRANHFPRGMRFRLFVKWFNGEEADIFTYKANQRGHLILEQVRRDPMYALCPLKNGERLFFVMKAEDNSALNAEISIVPFPIALKTKSGLKLSLELRGQDGEAFLLHGNGFYSGEVFEVTTLVQEKEHTYSVIASSKGIVEFPIKLELRDHDGGECSLSLTRSDDETIILPFKAGRAALSLAGAFALEIK
jgi:hypothetical protein